MSTETSKQLILLIDDDQYDFELIRMSLKEFPSLQFDFAQNFEEFLSLYKKDKYQAILSDYNINGVFGTEILVHVRKEEPKLPFIFISGAMGEQLVIDVLKMGATDYVLKENLKKLPFAYKRAITEYELIISEEKAVEDFIETSSRYRNILDNMNQGVVLSDAHGIIQYVNKKMVDMVGYQGESAIGMNTLFFASNDKKEIQAERLANRKTKGTETYESEIIHKNGKLIQVQVTATPIFTGEEFTGIFSTIIDITKERHQEKLIKYIQESLNVKTGQTFFSELIQFLSTTLQVKAVIVGFYMPEENAINPISFIANGIELESLNYSLEHSPCSNIRDNKIKIYEKDLQSFFPNNPHLEKLNAESYIGVPLYSSESKPIGILAIIDDKPLTQIDEKLFILNLITTRTANELARIKNEQALQLSEEFSRGILSALNSSIAVVDKQGVIISTNDIWINLAKENSRFKTQTDIGTNYLETCNKAYQDGDIIANEVALGIEAVLNNSIPLFEIEYPCTYTNEGCWFLMRVTPMSGTNGGAVILHLDISEKKKAEQELIDSEKKFRKLFDSIIDVFTQTDINGDFCVVSPSSLTVTGYTPEELIGESIGTLFKNESDIKFFNKLFKQKALYNYEIPIQTKTKQTKIISLNAVLKYDQNNNIDGIQAILRDVTEKKIIEQEREKLIAELTNSNNNLTQFNYIISHNLRAPVSSLMGLSKVLEMEISKTEQNVVNEFIITSIKNIDSLITDLNTSLASKVIGNRLRVDCDLKAISAKVIEELNQDIIGPPIEVKIKINEDANQIHSIKSYIQSLFYNLLSNAIKYRSHYRNLVISINISKVEDKTKIVISDNGIGIDLEKNKDKVFGLYMRFSKMAEGKGLGLYMTKSQIESIGGTITIESKVEVGTTFTIIL